MDKACIEIYKVAISEVYAQKLMNPESDMTRIFCTD